MTEVVRTQSEDETAGVARRLAGQLPPGSVVLLTGDLGAGKTAFVRGLAAGLGIDSEEVSSPTFTLVQEYRPSTGAIRPAPAEGRGEGSLLHVDLYRLQGAEIDDLGLDELSEGTAVVAIEWAEKLRVVPPGAIRVEIQDRGGDTREITIGADSWQRNTSDPLTATG
jgi:tRNA threonylcarbamoyladenosine biosynthesis protein TsaE